LCEDQKEIEEVLKEVNETKATLDEESNFYFNKVIV